MITAAQVLARLKPLSEKELEKIRCEAKARFEEVQKNVEKIMENLEREIKCASKPN